ncbi:MAG: hypothetical protein IJ233_01175 [Pyramidobacter sp.]|nr:hypothetical protein [Pyramidobacter sp.]
MATVSITQPDYGRTTGAWNGGLYTVSWSPPTGGNAGLFSGFRLICHACGQTLGSAATNPATFAIDSLVSDGHPGPFEIITDIGGGDDDVAVAVYAYTGQAGGGVAFPDSQIKFGSPGGSVSFKISAEPNDGYYFRGWSQSPDDDGNYRSTSKTLNVSTTFGYSDSSITYYAHFSVRRFRCKIDLDKQNVVGVSLSRTILIDESANTYSINIRNEYDVTIATASITYRYKAGDTVTATLTVADQTAWDALGLRIIGWRNNGELIESSSYSYSFTATRTSGTGGETLYEVDVRLAANVHLLTFRCGRQDDAVLTVRMVSSPVSYRGDFVGGKEGSPVIGYLPAGAVVTLGISSLRLANGAIHGWSEQLPGGTDEKTFTMPDSDATITVYVCTHLLMYGSGDKLLYGRAQKLLHDCCVPPDTTAYD